MRDKVPSNKQTNVKSSQTKNKTQQKNIKSNTLAALGNILFEC